MRDDESSEIPDLSGDTHDAHTVLAKDPKYILGLKLIASHSKSSSVLEQLSQNSNLKKVEQSTREKKYRKKRVS